MSQEKIWEYFQNDGVESFAEARPRYAYLARRIGRLLPAGSRVLNIGAGSGMLELMLKAAGYAVSTVDPSQAAISRLRERGIDARVGFAERLPFDDAMFDAVVASEVLEHLEAAQGELALGHVRRVLRAGGWFVGTVPLDERLADGRAVCPRCGELFHRWGHQRSFSRRDLAALLAVRFEAVNLITRAFVAWRGGLRQRAKSAIRLLLGRFGEPIASPHLYFECRVPAS